MAIPSSATSKPVDLLAQRWFQVLDGASLDSVTGLVRQGADLILTFADGRQVLLAQAFDDLSALDVLGSFPAQLQALIQNARDGAYAALAQAETGAPVPLVPPAAPDASIIGRVADATGDVKVQRNGGEQVLRNGDALLAGDVIVTSGSSQMRLEMLSGQSQVTGSGVVGENSKIVLGAQASAGASSSAQGAPVVFQVDSGAIMFDRFTAGSAAVQVVTPGGVVLPQGQGVGVSVNATSGETTVVGLNAFGVATGSGSTVQVVPLGSTAAGAQSNVGVSVPTQGLVLNPSNATGANGVAAASGAPALSISTTATSSPTGLQADPIAKLITTPSGNNTGAGAASPPGGLAFRGVCACCRIAACRSGGSCHQLFRYGR